MSSSSVCNNSLGSSSSSNNGPTTTFPLHHPLSMKKQASARSILSAGSSDTCCSEEEPSLRSVGCLPMSAKAATLVVSSSSPLESPSLPAGQVPMLSLKNALMTKPLLSKKAQIMIQSETEQVSQSEEENTWQSITRSDHLSVLPEIYPLSRTSVTVRLPTDEAVQQFVTNLSSTIQQNPSIVRTVYMSHCHTDDDEERNTATCITSSGGKICIRLFRKDEQGQEVVVEIQRLSGCSYDFKQVSKPILRHLLKKEKKDQGRRIKTKSFAIPDSVIDSFNEHGHIKCISSITN
jgi:hypothetical protein